MSKQQHRALRTQRITSRLATNPRWTTPCPAIRMDKPSDEQHANDPERRGRFGRLKTHRTTTPATRLVTTAILALAALAGNVAHAGDKAPDYSVPGVGTIVAWLFGR